MLVMHGVDHRCSPTDIANATATVDLERDTATWNTLPNGKRVVFCDQCGERLPATPGEVWTALMETYNRNRAAAPAGWDKV